MDKLLDWLLGPKCDRCLSRVFENDRPLHEQDCS